MDGRPTGSYPETGFEEVNGDLREADFWTVSLEWLSRCAISDLDRAYRFHRRRIQLLGGVSIAMAPDVAETTRIDRPPRGREEVLLASLPTLAARSWEQRKERIATDARSLARRLQDQTTLNEKTIKAKLLGELTEDDFHTMKASIDRETQQIQAQIAALDAETSSMTALMQQTDDEVINFGKSWDAAVPTRKREIQSALFPDGLAYDPETFYFCPLNPSLLQLLNAVLDDMGLVGVPDGI